MCQEKECIDSCTPTIEKKYRLADFFDMWWDKYIISPTEPIKLEHYKAANAIRTCRTEALGVDYYVCTECGELSEQYHSCKNRFCPTCSWKDTLDWANRIKNQMLNLPHRHVVFTLPHRLNGLIKSNSKELFNILFKAAADTFKDWMDFKYKLTPGIISVLHTFGETKDYHVHLHMIVSWGGISNLTKSLQAIKGEYVDYKFIQTKFRCKFEDALINYYKSGDMKHQFQDRIDFMRFIKQVNDKMWRIHLEPAMNIPTQVIRYIGRYSKRACLSEYKITEIDGENISFRHKDYKNLDINNKPIERELTLNYQEFFPRLLQHVPLRYFRIVRYYGVYSTKSKIAPEYLYVGSKEEELHINQQSESEESYEIEDPCYCKVCNKQKLYVHTEFKSKRGTKVIMSKYPYRRRFDKHKSYAA